MSDSFYCPYCGRDVKPPHFCDQKGPGGGIRFKLDVLKLWNKLNPEPPQGPEENPYDRDRAHYRQELEAGRMSQADYDRHMKAIDDLERLWKRINEKE